jgi:FdhD protein
VVSPVLRPAGTPAATVVIDAVNERGETVATSIAGEHALTLYLDRREIVTLMTLAQAPEALALGYLRNQRLLPGIEEIAAVQVDWDVGAVAVTTRGGSGRVDALLAKRTVTTGCGQGTLFGDLMEQIGELRLCHAREMHEDTLHALLEQIRGRPSIYKQAGAVHGCALAGHDGRLRYFVEDVGRHNAVDAIAGQMWLDGVDGADKVFYTTGRLTSEMVIKCAVMGVPFLVSRSGLTHMAWRIAQHVGLTMIGRAQGQHYLLFTGAERFRRRPPVG